jgi:two-component system, OmpR family, sensor histidine kinase CreC
MDASQRERFLQNILTETNRIQAMIDSMLALSVIEGQKNLQRIQSVDIESLINTVVEANESILIQKQIYVETKGLADIKIQGDPLLLHQAVSNLLQNAVDFSPEKSRIEICGQIEGQLFKLCVKDAGTGIPDYAANKVFDKFFSLQRPGTGKKSTGLGLNFVKEVAVLHNGHIRLENRNEKGLCATLSIPI